MSLLQSIRLVYQHALEQARAKEREDVQKQTNVKRMGNLVQQGVSQALSATPAVNYAATMFPQSTLTGITSQAAPAASSLATASSPTIGPLASAAGGTGAAATGAAAGAGTSAGASAGASGASGASTISSGLASSGIGAIIGAGLAIGTSRPGDTLFPVKKFMYNTTLPVYNISGGYVLDKLLGKYSPRSVADWVFGNPNEQLAEYRRNNARAVALQSASRLSNINDKMQAWGQPEEMEVEG